MTDSVPPGWYPDPDDGGISQRFWDGQDWTERVRSAHQPRPTARPVQSPPAPASQLPVNPAGQPESRLTQFAKRMNGGDNNPPPPPRPPDQPRRRFNDPAGEVIFLLRSIRAMLIFFTVLTVIGIIFGVVAFVQLLNAANDSGF